MHDPVSNQARSNLMDNPEGGMMAKTKLGMWSIGLIIAMPLFFILGTTLSSTMYDSVPAGETIWADISTRPSLSIPMLAGFASGIVAFITGLIAVLKQKERALLVYVAVIIGGALIVFLAGEVISPH